jgi:hypothetical protein
MSPDKKIIPEVQGIKEATEFKHLVSENIYYYHLNSSSSYRAFLFLILLFLSSTITFGCIADLSI